MHPERRTHLATCRCGLPIPTVNVPSRLQVTSRPQSQLHRPSHEAEQKATGVLLSDETSFSRDLPERLLLLEELGL